MYIINRISSYNQPDPPPPTTQVLKPSILNTSINPGLGAHLVELSDERTSDGLSNA